MLHLCMRSNYFGSLLDEKIANRWCSSRGGVLEYASGNRLEFGTLKILIGSPNILNRLIA